MPGVVTERTPSTEEPDGLLIRAEAARAAAATGDLPAARAGFERAVENLRDAMGADAPETRRAERQAAAAGAAAASAPTG